jgi:hypothetical protein
VSIPFVWAFLPPIGRVHEEVARKSKLVKGERKSWICLEIVFITFIGPMDFN